MKIGIESQRIFREHKHGMDVVALELIRQIQLIDKTNQYVLFAKNGGDRNCITDTNSFITSIVKGITYADWEQLSLPVAVNKERPDILHCTANTAPLNCRIPMIVTIHDVMYLEKTSFKGSAYQNVGNLYRKLVVPHAIRKAKKIITVSSFEKSVITDVCKTDPEKIIVIHNGVDKRFHPEYEENVVAGFRQQYKLPDDYILFLGNTAPKKNTEGVLKAYVHYSSMVGDFLPLVIPDYKEEYVKKLLRAMKRPELSERCITPGYIPSPQMPLLYNGATLFLYPSFRESFGLPVLEAMASGIPVIASGIPALREVASDAAVFIDPTDPVGIAHAMHSLLSDEQKRINLKKRGIARAGLFSWENAAKKLVDVYNGMI